MESRMYLSKIKMIRWNCVFIHLLMVINQRIIFQENIEQTLANTCSPIWPGTLFRNWIYQARELNIRKSNSSVITLPLPPIYLHIMNNLVSISDLIPQPEESAVIIFKIWMETEQNRTAWRITNSLSPFARSQQKLQGCTCSTRNTGAWPEQKSKLKREKKSSRCSCRIPLPPTQP